MVDGILRVGGRLEMAPLGFETKHPIILPKLSLHAFNCLIVRDYHFKCGHSGLNHTLAQGIGSLGATATVRRIMQHIYSDNGTNLVRAECVLRQAINSWNQDQIYEHLGRATSSGASTPRPQDI